MKCFENLPVFRFYFLFIFYLFFYVPYCKYIQFFEKFLQIYNLFNFFYLLLPNKNKKNIIKSPAVINNWGESRLNLYFNRNQP